VIEKVKKDKERNNVSSKGEGERRKKNINITNFLLQTHNHLFKKKNIIIK